MPSTRNAVVARPASPPWKSIQTDITVVWTTARKRWSGGPWETIGAFSTREAASDDLAATRKHRAFQYAVIPWSLQDREPPDILPSARK